MIVFENVSKAFKSHRVLDSVAFEIPKGKITFLIGRSGQGKSVCLKLITGLLEPDRGRIVFDGTAVTGFSERQWMKIRRRCSLIFQAPALLDSMSVAENLLLGIRAHRVVSSRAMEKALCIEKLAEVGLGESYLNKRPNALSLGTQKRVSIARALVLGSECLLFDEPTTGLDPISTARIHFLIKALGRSGKTVLVVSHDMQCALDAADQIILLDRGKVIARSDAEGIRLLNHPLAVDFLKEANARSIHR